MQSVVSRGGRHFGGIFTRLVVELLERRLGEGAVAEVLDAAGEQRPVAVLVDDASWSTYDQFRRLLEEAARRLGSTEALIDIGTAPSIGTGSKPQFTALLLETYRSPLEMAQDLRLEDLSPAVSLTTEAAGPSAMVQHAHLADGFEIFPELCAFLLGSLRLSVRIFGLQPLDVRELSCRLHGADKCSFLVTWDETENLSLRLEHARFELDVSRSRLAAFQETVGDIVAAVDVDTVLGRIVAGAARSSVASGFILEIDGLAGGTRRYPHGVDSRRGDEISRRAAEGEPGVLTVEVASQHRSYGRLYVLGAEETLAFEQTALEGYARLAATALDSTFALDEARRQADTSRALLELSTSLAELSASGDMAAKLARALPAVIDADCSAVLLVADGMARVAAYHGFSEDEAATIDRFGLDVRQHPIDRVLVRTTDGATESVEAVLAAAGLEALAVAPITIDGEILGLLTVGVRTRPERLTADDQLADRFSGLAGQAAVALRNERLVDQIRYQSLHDPLTDLPNRALILDRAHQMTARARRTRVAAAVLFIDLDGFKEINDTLGHAIGDELLKVVARRLHAAVRDNDTVGRLGGDEFVVLVEDATFGAGIDAVAERLLEVVSKPVRIEGRERPLAVTASIGVALGDRLGAGDLLRDADIALYSAKAAGKCCFRIFAPEMEEELRRRAELADGLGQALDQGQLFLVYQPILHLASESTTAVEALLRWNHPLRGVVPPDEFIPLLEETGQIVEVGRWVLQEACRQTVEWHQMGHRIDVSVNASVRQLERPDFVDDVRESLRISGLPATSLIVEITETAIMRDARATMTVLERIKELGVRVAIDDFGTGYSSLAYLRQFPVDALKIDRSFIASVADSPAAAEVIHTLIRLGEALELDTLAEGIEHPDQLEHLQSEGCHSGQGYMFARPMAPDDLEAFLTRQSRPGLSRCRPDGRSSVA